MTTDPAPADDLPVLRMDTARLESWIRLASEVSLLVRDSRTALGRRAFSDAEEAALDHDQAERSATEALVQPLTPQETRAWRTQPHPEAEQRTTTDLAGEHGLRVRVGPMPTGRWAMAADVHRLTPDGQPVGDPVATTTVSCATEQLAREIADELLSTGPDPEALTRIATYAAGRADRRAAASGQVTESAQAREARTRAAIRQTWNPRLAQRVLASDAFDALAARLHQLEERGTPMADVLVRLSQPSLMGPKVRDPARLAAWMCDSLLTVIDSEAVTTAPPTTRPSPAPRPSPRPRATPTAAPHPTPRTATPAESTEPDWRHTVAEDTVWPALRATLPEQLCHTLRASSGYERLVEELVAKTAAGWAPDGLLSRLPADKISQADDPARYLAAIVANRAQQNPPLRTGVDKIAMAAVVREAFPEALADQVLSCPAWPALATRMSQAQATSRDGDPSLAQTLRDLPLAAIGNARKPAAYTGQLLARHLGARHDDPRPPLASEGYGVSTRPLDPASAIDRIALDDTAPVPDRSASEWGAAAHRQAAADATREADREERAAGYEHTDPQSDRTAGTGHDAVCVASLDDHLAAAARATAAEETDAAVAAALRADTMLTQTPSRASDQQPRRTRDGQPARTHARTLTQTRKRGR